MNAEREFLDFAAGLFGVDPSALSLATAYGSLPEWGSVMQLRLVMEFEVSRSTSTVGKSRVTSYTISMEISSSSSRNSLGPVVV